MADVSLDDYMKGGNFRVQISNPGIQRIKPPGFNQGKSQIKSRLGLQTRKAQGTQTFKNSKIQINKPVSVTLQGVSKITFDARDKISTKQKPKDAREKLNQGKPVKFTDARIQITNLKAKHGDKTQGANKTQVANDARQKITAKRQNSSQGKITLQTKSSVQANAPKVTFRNDSTARQIGNKGQITVQGFSSTPQNSLGQVTVMGTGPGRQPAGQGQITVTGLGEGQNFVRTINNGSAVGPNYGEPQMPSAAPTSYDFSITRTVEIRFDYNDRGEVSGALRHIGNISAIRDEIKINSGGPSVTPVNPMMVHPVIQYQSDPYRDVPAPHFNPVHADSHQYVPVYQQEIPVQTVYQDTPVQRHNPNISVKQLDTVPSGYQDISVHRSDTGQYSYEETYEEDDYYEIDDSLEYNAPAVVPKIKTMEKTLTVKKPVVKSAPTVLKTKPQTVPTAVKRKAAPAAVGGPLKLYKAPSELVVPVKKAKPSVPPIVSHDDDVEIEDEDANQEEDPVTVLSPLQGYKILVSNLHPIVTQDDIIELFGAIGPMKKARLPKAGFAEIVYVQKDSALKAVQKYNNRELDGQPMQVKLLTSNDAQVKQPVESPVKLNKPLGEPLRLGKDAPKKSNLNFDVGLLHKALFKTGAPGVAGANKPVTFTVKI